MNEDYRSTKHKITEHSSLSAARPIQQMIDDSSALCPKSLWQTPQPRLSWHWAASRLTRRPFYNPTWVPYPTKRQCVLFVNLPKTIMEWSLLVKPDHVSGPVVNTFLSTPFRSTDIYLPKGLRVQYKILVELLLTRCPKKFRRLVFHRKWQRSMLLTMMLQLLIGAAIDQYSCAFLSRCCDLYC